MSQLPERNVDIVFCIDGTGSMTPCIDNVKRNALKFHDDLVEAVKADGSMVTGVRVKVIMFRDYKSDDDAMVISPFFELPTDEEEFAHYLAGITAHGGCGEDANGLEAMYFAMKSDWVTGPRDRQVIVTFADTDAINIGRRSDYPGYPTELRDKRDFFDTWECVSQTGSLRDRLKRAVIFAPAGSNYEDLSQQMPRSIFKSVDPGRGMADIDFASIVKTISASVSSK